MDDSSTNDTLFPLVAAGAALSVASLAVLQTDRVSRWMLSPPRLLAKRRQEYSYRWKTAMEKTHLQLEYCLAGGIRNFDSDPEINLKNMTYLGSEQEQERLVEQIVSKQSTSHFSALKLDRDPSDKTGEFYLFLMKHPQEDCEAEFFQLPLVAFCQKLQVAFENQLTTTTLCFVADASSGKAIELLEELVQESKTGVAVVSEPLWMSNLARLAEAKLYSTSKLKSIMFALCRLDAWALREAAKSSHTVMITLPGQSTIPTLLPLVQSVFPEDRHVFAYDDCTSSVARSMRQLSEYGRGSLQLELGNIISSMAQNPIRHAVPLPSHSPLTKSILTLENALAKVPISQAQTVESWMASVDAFLKVKEEETKNGYLPYVFKLSLLIQPVGDFAQSTASYWSLSSVLQFVTGTRSRPVSEFVMDAAREFLKDYNRMTRTKEPPVQIMISEAEKKAIENCVFQHKSILIGNKTLKDTVLPTHHWTLKQASRAGCSCCGPDPYERMEEEEDAGEEVATRKSEGMVVAGVDMSVPGAFATVMNKENNGSAAPSRASPSKPANSGYVDGKMSFAFDPAKFS